MPPASTDAATAPSPPLGAAAASAPPMDLTPLAGAGVSPPHPSWGRHAVPGHSSSSSSRAGRPGVLPGWSVAVGRPSGGPSGRNGFHRLAALIHPTAAASHAMLAKNAIR